MAAREGSDVDVLLRWVEAGGVWRVSARRHDHVEIELMRCDAGEVVERLSTSEPEALAHVEGRTGSDD